MNQELKVNLLIAGRTYPLVVNNVEEEARVREAAKQINKLIGDFEGAYEVSDKQDVLAMCALHFASNAKINEKAIEKQSHDWQETIDSILLQLNKALKD